MSEEDWTDVRLSLISGTPVSFIQPIQKPFYRYRPIIPVPDDLRMSPQVYNPMAVRLLYEARLREARLRDQDGRREGAGSGR